MSLANGDPQRARRGVDEEMPAGPEGVTGVSVEVSVEEAGKTTVIRIRGSIDATTSLGLETVLRELVTTARDAGAGRSLQLDLGQVDFIDSVGLTVLVNARLSSSECGVSIELANVPANVRRVLAITRLDEMFELRSD